MKRRTVLAGTGALLGAGGLAGCLGGAPGTAPTDTPTDPPDGTSTPTESPAPTESPSETPTPSETPPSGSTAEFRVTARECGLGENSASIEFGNGEIVVRGTIGGRNTCYTASLRPIRRRDGTLVVPVVAAPEETTETRACGQCLTDIDYVARVEPDDPPAEVVVEHDGEVVTRASRP